MKNLLFKTLRFIFGSSVFLAIWALHAFWVCKNQTLNSDLLYLESLYTDVISLQRPIGRFIFTEAMFLFPDFALYSLVRHFFAQPLEALVAYITAFDLVFFAALYWAFRTVYSRSTSFFVYLLLLVTTLLLGFLAPDYRHVAFLPNHHGFLQVLFLITFVMVLNQKWPYLIVFGLTFLAAFSDLLSIPSIFLPAALVLSTLKQTRGRAWTIFAAFTLAYLTNQILIYTHHMVSLPFPFTLGEGYESRMKIAESFQYFPASLPGILKRNAYVFFGAVFMTWWLKEEHGSLDRKTFLAYSGLSILLTSVALMAMGRWPSIDANLRYIQQFSYAPIFWISLFSVPRLSISKASIHLLLSMGLSTLLYMAAPWEENPEALWQKPLVSQCLDLHAAELPTPWGLGGYYIAKVVTFTSHAQVYVNQVKPNFSAYPWMISPEWFRQDIHKREIGNYSFMIARNKAEAAKATDYWGKPKRQIACAPESPEDNPIVMIYPSGIQPGEWDLSPAD